MGEAGMDGRTALCEGQQLTQTCSRKKGVGGCEPTTTHLRWIFTSCTIHPSDEQGEVIFLSNDDSSKECGIQTRRPCGPRGPNLDILEKSPGQTCSDMPELARSGRFLVGQKQFALCWLNLGMQISGGVNVQAQSSSP